ncbi:AAA domain-containing protein [Bradyrhizobium sp. dw_411]|uniref:AAA domain-containing protein n=1 Tax=Bradyrhizobium sp. dw_411 TaxID=2720082 RepID=UPI001BCF5704|nr:AAA domain-containing protein [Bradyrhizobium sp. dw_411]
MKIEFLNPQGPQPTEMVGLTELRTKLPSSWRGFANFNMRNTRQRGQDREIDVVLIVPDRLILVDLKHMRGRIESRSGRWYKGTEDIGQSAANKVRENAKVFADLIRKQVSQIPGSPPIESAVVFTHHDVDLGGLTQNEKDRCFKLVDFLRIANPSEFAKPFTARSNFGADETLNSGPYFQALQKLFTNGKFIEPRKAKYHGFIPTGDPEFEHALFEEYACNDVADPNYAGLLRIWDFSKDPDTFALEEERRPVAERERALLGYVRTQNPNFFDNYVLRSIAHDRDYSLRYTEIFERHDELARLTRLAGSMVDLEIERRIELSRLFLDRVASLHRMRIAHRDLDRHSVWVNERRSSIVLSGFGASHYPERQTLGDQRAKLLASGHRVPEDTGDGKPGTVFQQDVFLAAATVWILLTGERLPALNGVPVWSASLLEANKELPPELGPWFDTSMSIDAADRYVDGVEGAEKFGEALAKNNRIALDQQLNRFVREVDPLVDFPVLPNGWIVKRPYRVFKARYESEASTVLVKSWPSQYLGDRRKSAARLLDFFARTERLEVLAADWAPCIRLSCLCMDGLLLIQDWVEGETLAAPSTVAPWSLDILKEFLLKFVLAVEELHKAGLAHGDLKPSNVVVSYGVDDDNAPRPVLIDLLDYSPEGAGERMTLAYCPPHSADDIQLRDRFAVGQIVRELVASFADRDQGLVQKILAAVDACDAGDEPWISLRPLRDALTTTTKLHAPIADLMHLSIEIRNPLAEGPMLADNGSFHVVTKFAESTIVVYGFDQKVDIKIDLADGIPRYAGTYSFNTMEADWALNHCDFSFKGEVKISRSATPRFSGFEGLRPHLAKIAGFNPDSTGPIQSAVLGLPKPIQEVSPEATRKTGLLQLAKFPVVRFWQETIAVEESIQPELTLVEAPRETHEPGIIILSCAEAIGDLSDFGDGSANVSVTWNGIKVGDLDSERSKGDLITIRNARFYNRLRTGDTLKIQFSNDLASFQRRSRAVARILQGKGQLTNLVQYFDPQASLTPEVMAEAIEEGALDDYGLNDDQEEAFRHLWRHGPVGLLQGPPGTGKTLFIASFVHWALSKKGQMRNVLVLSQSHEAVNTAAERILKVFGELGGEVDLLRIGQHDKISPPLLRYHSQSIQDRNRELFQAEIKERLAIAARKLGLNRSYVKESYEVEATFGALVRQINLSSQDAQQNDADAVRAARQRLGSLEASFHRLVSEKATPYDGLPSEILEDIRDDTARRHVVFDPDARRRFLKLEELSRKWVSVLNTRNRNLEEFFARSRNLVCGTCVGIGRQGMRIDRGTFDLVIIDEAARCTPGELAVGMQSGKRVLLVGDHRQLPPLFGHELLSEVSTKLPGIDKKELQRSDFERAFGSSYGKSNGRTLRKQYRMAPEIGAIVSDVFYPGEKLETLRGAPHVIYSELPAPLDQQILWIDTGSPGKGGRETASGTSFTNRREAVIILELLRRIARCKSFMDNAAQALELKDGEPLVGVICTYAQQAELLENMLLASDVPPAIRSLVKIDTVDAYQGKENRIVILSLVRSNPESNMGFVRNQNRINVALSRAMDRLILVGAAAMFEHTHNPLRSVVKRLRMIHRIRSSANVLGL